MSCELNNLLAETQIGNWNDIDSFLEKISNISSKESENPIKSGIAFLTFDFGIDGVSIEIAKYAECFENLYKDIPVSVIAGDFHEHADLVLKENWKRHHIPGANGWGKWFGGKTFDKLFSADMPEGELSDNAAIDVWKDTVSFAENLSNYLQENNISYLIPVNIATNPGNFALNLATIIVTEFLGINVISSNHDFYWEGGMPAEDREDGYVGPRDHFFRNHKNKEFFDLLVKTYPWNGSKWLQVNINDQQVRELIEVFKFPRKKIHELGTSISESFFYDFSVKEQITARKKMQYILSDGDKKITTVGVKEHYNNLESWMQNQKPIVCGLEGGIKLDIAKSDIIYCLQPTRVVERKRIEKDVELLQSLFNYPNFKKEFAKDERSIVLHITGPVPIEHIEDLQLILKEFINLTENLSPSIAEKIFIAFSVATESHPSLSKNKLSDLTIEEIYRLATVILFPSETEGRGLPIIESSASGIPIVCSRYYPEEVFDEVIGKDLDEELQIQYIPFPELNYTDEFLDVMTDLLLHQSKFDAMKLHNKNVVRKRFSTEMLTNKFKDLVESF